MSLDLTLKNSQFNFKMANLRENKIYEFAEFRLDATHLLLCRNNEEISLTPKAVETLLALVQRRGEVVGKDELMGKIWSDAVVEESNLSQYLHILRKTLGKQSDGKPFIETLKRRGYRFNGEVRVSDSGFSPPGRADAEKNKNGFSLNEGSKYEIKKPNSLHQRVERRGNVLALADWTESEKNSGASELTERQNAVSNSEISNLKSKRWLAVAVVVVILLAAVLFVRYRFAPNSAASPFSDESKKELTILHLTNGGEPLDATVSPDGNYFVYHEQNGATARLWLQQTGQTNRLEIVPPMEKIIGGKTFSPDASFVYFIARAELNAPGALYRVPTLGGAASKILDDINTPPSFSPDGSEMVFQRYNFQTRESSLIIAAAEGGSEKVLLARKAEQGFLGFPAWSPDGNLIAFEASKIENSRQVAYAILAVNRQTGENLTLSAEKWENCYRMVWTRDGSGLVVIGTKLGEAYSTRRDQIYYLSYPSGEARRLTSDGSRYQIFSLGITDSDEIIAVPFNRLSQIWALNPNGDARTAVQITDGLADGRAGLVPLADGRIGYIARTGDNLNVLLMDTDGANRKQLFSDLPFVEELRAAPDGKFFVFSTKRDGRNHLFRIDADGANLRQLTFSDIYEVDSTVSPDGDWIVYDSESVSGGTGKRALWKVPSSGGEQILLTDIDCAAPHFSPDGKTLSCVYQEREIFIVSAIDGSTVKTFDTVKIPALNSGARFSPDGQALIYVVHQKNFSNLWRQPVAGGAAEPLTDFTSGDIYNFAFAPDGSRLYVARGYQITDTVLIKNFK